MLPGNDPPTDSIIFFLQWQLLQEGNFLWMNCLKMVHNRVINKFINPACMYVSISYFYINLPVSCILIMYLHPQKPKKNNNNNNNKKQALR